MSSHGRQKPQGQEAVGHPLHGSCGPQLSLAQPVLIPVNLPPPQLFYGPLSGTTRVSRCQKRTSELYGGREDYQRQTDRPSGWVTLHPD